MHPRIAPSAQVGLGGAIAGSRQAGAGHACVRLDGCAEGYDDDGLLTNGALLVVNVN